MMENLIVRLSDSFQDSTGAYRYRLTINRIKEFSNHDGETDTYYDPVFQEYITVENWSELTDVLEDRIKAFKENCIKAITEAKFVAK